MALFLTKYSTLKQKKTTRNPLEQNLTNEEFYHFWEQDGEKAIEWLFRNYYSYLCKVVFKIIPDSNLVEDLVQEVFFEVWKKKNQIQFNTSIKAYLRRSAVNRSLNYIRDQRIKFEQEDKVPFLESKEVGIVQKIEAEDLKIIIDKCIDELPERCRIVFVLSRFEDMSYKEIAEELDISPKTVENQVSKALKYLRKALGPYVQLVWLLVFWSIT